MNKLNQFDKGYYKNQLKKPHILYEGNYRDTIYALREDKKLPKHKFKTFKELWDYARKINKYPMGIVWQTKTYCLTNTNKCLVKGYRQL